VGQLEPELGPEEGVRDLEEDAGAVAGVLLGADGAPVVEVLQRGEAGLDDLTGRSATERGDEGHAAGVVLVRGVVQPLPRRRSGLWRVAVDRPHEVFLSSRLS